MKKMKIIKKEKRFFVSHPHKPEIDGRFNFFFLQCWHDEEMQLLFLHHNRCQDKIKFQLIMTKYIICLIFTHKIILHNTV